MRLWNTRDSKGGQTIKGVPNLVCTLSTPQVFDLSDMAVTRLMSIFFVLCMNTYLSYVSAYMFVSLLLRGCDLNMGTRLHLAYMYWILNGTSAYL